jgi:hypothetical protein
MSIATPLLRLLPLLAAIAALAFATAGGLARLGLLDAAAIAAPTRLHAALMICGFLGTVISLERAVALRATWAFAAPLTAALGAVLALAGQDASAILAWLAAAALLLAASVAIVRVQDAPHTRLLAVASASWLLAQIALLAGAAWDAVLLLWFDFLVLTIAAERLELTRLMRRRPVALPLLVACVVVLVLGALVVARLPALGHTVHGLALIALAGWLFAFDLARHTISTEGVARYAAACLLGGYAWLAVAGVAQLTYGQGLVAARDVLLHALGLGFVVSMIFGHAPIILPAVARLPVAFSAYFWLPLALLHGSLLLRFAGSADIAVKGWAAWLNALSIALFIGGVLRGVLSARRRPGRRNGRRR